LLGAWRNRMGAQDQQRNRKECGPGWFLNPRYLLMAFGSVRTLRWRSEEIPDLSTVLFASRLPRRTRKLPPW
jgi:hypothetical protein